MKNTIKVFGIIALVALIGFTATACNNKGGAQPTPSPAPPPSPAPAPVSAPAAPSGTYAFTALEAWTITFGQGTFTMFIPASVAPSGADMQVSGNFTVSGDTLTLTGLAQAMVFTITNSTTLTESDGSIWKAAAVGATLTISVANDSDFPVNAAVYGPANISGGQVGDFIEIKPVYEGQSGSFSLDAGSYGIILARDAQTVWMYPQSGGGGGPGLSPMSGAVNLRFTGTEIVRQ